MIALAAKQKLAGGFTRRGACPALSAPMQTGDGLLVRLNPVAGGLSPKALIGLCDAAETYGNGVIEVTARGSLQIRGLTERSAGEFAAAVDKLGIAARTGVPVQTGVLAGLDPDEIADPTPLAESIRIGIATAGLEARLGPKVSVVVDGGGRSGLDEVAADIRLTAVREGGRPVWQVAIAGDARTARTLGIAECDEAACDAALSVLAEVAAIGRETRARDLSADRLPSVLRYLEVSRSTFPPSGLPAISPSRGEISSFDAAPRSATVEIGEGRDEGIISPLEGEMAGRPEGGAKERCGGESLVGTMDLRHGLVGFGTALPFGHTTGGQLKTLAETARKLGVEDIRPAPGRTLVAICGMAEAAEALRKQAETLGLVTSPDDPRQAISACPGAPDCASGHIPARRLAAEISSEYGSLLDGSMHLHISGCAKGCAHPGKAELTVIGSGAGTGLVFGGTARDEPLAFAAGDGGRRGLAGIAAFVSAERCDAETTAQTIQRIGLSALAETFKQGAK